MKFLILFLYLFTVTSATTNLTYSNDQLVECPCPSGFDDECTEQKICVYGVNDEGEIFHNGKNDAMELTKIALQKMAEIRSNDDVLVNLYNPRIKPMVIFYYGCRKCDDLKQLGNFTVPKLRIFLLSLYNQRMKYNIKYAQSDFVYYSSDDQNRQQPMPEITVRPFWKNRLMLNQSCARKQQGFTQKHFIPAFLTQDLCILDYKSVNDLHYNAVYRTENGEIIYSPTLSYIDLYSYNILPNSTHELPSASHNQHELCKMTFNLESKFRIIRFFCLCPTDSCTLKVTQKDPMHCCPYQMNVTINATMEYTSLTETSDYMPVDEFFLQDEKTYCYFRWQVYGSWYRPFIQRVPSFLPNGYYFDTRLSYPKLFCPFFKYKIEHIDQIYATFYKNDTRLLRNAFMGAIIDHTKIINTTYSLGANCLSEGPLSHPLYSSSYGSDSKMYNCYKYFELYYMWPIFPMMGINMLPLKIIAKGKKCYYYTVKVHQLHTTACVNVTYPFQFLMTIMACPENATLDNVEIARVQNIVNACPTMKPGESQWKYETSGWYPANLCAQFFRGLKLENGKYVPEEIELRQTNMNDFEITEMSKARIFHGCGFNASLKLTMCTCFSTLGGCDNLYTIGRLHLLRYLPTKDE